MVRLDTGDKSPDGAYSWFVALVGTVAMVFTFGTPYSYGVFLTPFGELFGLSSVVLSTVFAVQLFAFFVGAGIIGVLATRMPVQYILVGVALVTAAVAPSLYVVDSYLGLLIVFGTLGTAVGTSYVVLASVVPQWFNTHRGVATGVLLSGVGISLFVFPPAWGIAFDHLGVRRAFLSVVLVHAASFALAGLVCRRPPWTDPPTISTAELGDWVRRLIRARKFHLAALGIGLSFAWYNLLAAYAVELFVGRGLSAYVASTAFGLIGGVSIGSRVLSGAIADRAGFRRTYLGFLGCAVLGSGLLLVPSILANGLAVFIYGVALGGIGALYIPLVLEVFGSENDTAVIGVFNVVLGLFAITAPPVATLVLTRTDSFGPIVGLTLLTTIGALFAIERID